MIIKRNSMKNDIASDLSSSSTIDRGGARRWQQDKRMAQLIRIHVSLSALLSCVPLLHLVTHHCSISIGILWYHMDCGTPLTFWRRSHQDSRGGSSGSMELCIYLYSVIQLQISFPRRFSFLFLLYVQQYSEKKETFDSHD